MPARRWTGCLQLERHVTSSALLAAARAAGLFIWPAQCFIRSMSGPLVLAVPPFSHLGNLGLALRRQVFVLEQQVPAKDEFDVYDLTATHLVSVLDGDVVGALRILFLLRLCI